MRYIQILTIFFILSIFESCASTNYIQGSYTNVYFGIAGEEFKFTQNPNKFEYYSRTEGTLKGYSLGTWKQDKKKIFLHGFDNKNINVLHVESKTEDSRNENRDKIVVKYRGNPLDTFTKVDIIINESSQVSIPGDTVFFMDAAVRTLQIKSYLLHEGLLLGAPPLIDTLYSKYIEVAYPNKHKIILLKFNVVQDDFYRTKITDTLIAKNHRTLLWHNKEFKKIKE